MDLGTVAERLGAAFLAGAGAAALFGLLCDLPAERLLSCVLRSAGAFDAIFEPALLPDLAALDGSFLSTTGALG